MLVCLVAMLLQYTHCHAWRYSFSASWLSSVRLSGHSGSMIVGLSYDTQVLSHRFLLTKSLQIWFITPGDDGWCLSSRSVDCAHMRSSSGLAASLYSGSTMTATTSCSMIRAIARAFSILSPWFSLSVIDLGLSYLSEGFCTQESIVIIMQNARIFSSLVSLDLR